MFVDDSAKRVDLSLFLPTTMHPIRSICYGFSPIFSTCGLLSLLAIGPLMAQSAKVAGDSRQYTPDTTKKELAVGFRLADDVAVTSVQAAVEGKDSLPATWEAWDGDKAPACAWMIVVDSSNLARAKTVAAGVELVRSFLTGLPKQDSVAVYTLARDLVEASPFGSSAEDRSKSLTGIKPAGDAALSTLIYTNLREGLGKITERKEPRKALLVLTDGKDETPGDGTAQEISKKKLIEAAKAAGIVVHTVGYAEAAADQSYFAGLKEISAETDGLFFPTTLATKGLPTGALPLLRGVMHGAGTVRIDLSKLAAAAPLAVTIKTAAGKTAVLSVPQERVVKAMEASPSELEKRAKDEQSAKDKVIAEKAAKDKEVADKVAKEKEAADQVAKVKEIAAKAAKDKAAVKKRDTQILAAIGVGVALLLGIVFKVRSSRKRAAAEARAAEEVRFAEETRLADAARRTSEQTKKAEAPTLAWLEMCDAQQTRHPVRMSTLKIGRGQHNDFVLRNDSVSGNHCVLNCNREGQWGITDLDSGNGVVLNGESVRQAPLKHGDVIELGELKMRFLLKA